MDLVLNNVIYCTKTEATETVFYIGHCNRRSCCTAKDSGFGGLEVACWPLVPKFTGSNPAEAVGFFRAKKSSARLPSEGK